MALERRSRAFWKRLVAEIERGSSVARVAAHHDVRPKTLAWWRWTLRREAPATTTSARLLPVVLGSEGAVTAMGAIEPIAIEIRDVTFRVPVGSDVNYVAALVAEIRATC